MKIIFQNSNSRKFICVCVCHVGIVVKCRPRPQLMPQTNMEDFRKFRAVFGYFG